MKARRQEENKSRLLLTCDVSCPPLSAEPRSLSPPCICPCELWLSRRPFKIFPLGRRKVALREKRGIVIKTNSRADALCLLGLSF